MSEEERLIPLISNENLLYLFLNTELGLKAEIKPCGVKTLSFVFNFPDNTYMEFRWISDKCI